MGTGYPEERPAKRPGEWPGRPEGITSRMSEPTDAPGGTDDDQVERRASGLLPEERAVGSDDPEAQADAILEESDQRSDERNSGPHALVERRTSDETVAPGDDDEPPG